MLQSTDPWSYPVRMSCVGTMYSNTEVPCVDDQRRQDNDTFHYCIIRLHTSLHSIRIVVHCTLYGKAWLNTSRSSWRISPSYSRGSDRLRIWFRETWVFVPRTLIILLTLVQQGGYYKCTIFFFHSVTAWQLKQRGIWARGMEWCFSCSHSVSPVRVRLPSINRRCCFKAMSSKRSAVNHWSSRPSIKEETKG